MNERTADVSVIVPCYRCSNTIERAIKSVANQSLVPREVILVEDCSGDGTLNKLYELQNKYSMEWIKIIRLNKNCGPATARNAGWNNASQEYIAFLDADDSWHPDKINIQYTWMKENQNAALTAHGFSVLAGGINHGNKGSPLPTEPNTISKFKLLLSNRFPTPTVMLKRNIPLRFLENKRYSEDFLLWLQIAHEDFKCLKFPSKLTFLHKSAYGESGLSAQLWKMQLGEIDNYKHLYHSKKINFPTLITLYAYSYLKYFRRILISQTRKAFQTMRNVK